MNRKKSFALALLLTLILAVALPVTGFAANETSGADAAESAEAAEATVTSGKALACAIAIGLGAGLGALAMGIASGKASEAIARQPEAVGQVRSSMMLSFVFIETAIIYALLIVILIICVL